MRRRWDVIADLCKEHGLRLGAEIGVAEGRFSAALLDLCPHVLLIAVDDFAPGYTTWMGTKWTAERQAVNRAKFEAVGRRHPVRLSLLNVPSLEAANGLSDGTLDFVFIDADHGYDAVKADIAAWLPKIRPGGWVTGHDYDLEKFPGVVRAVEETFADFHIKDDFVWMAQI
jgi:Methyltransferase domain